MDNSYLKLFFFFLVFNELGGKVISECVQCDVCNFSSLTIDLYLPGINIGVSEVHKNLENMSTPMIPFYLFV
jgi:hypothetical protein